MQRNPLDSDAEEPLESIEPLHPNPTPPAVTTTTTPSGGILRLSAWDQLDTEFVVSAMEEIQEFTAFHFLPIAQNLTSDHVRSFLECAAVKR
jgi:hypothetical protein